MKYDYTNDDAAENESNADEPTFLLPNLGALNTWNQIAEMPKYMQAWTALTESTNALFHSNLLNRFYAYNALYYMFDDKDLVDKYVLAGID